MCKYFVNNEYLFIYLLFIDHTHIGTKIHNTKNIYIHN